MYWRPLSSPFHAPRQLRVALRFSLRRSHYLITSSRQVVYGLNLFHSRLPLRPLAPASPQFYAASRVCDRLSQMVVLFGCPSFWQFFLSQNLISHKFSRVYLQMKILSPTIYSSGRGLRETTRRWAGETKIFRSSYDLQLENASSLFQSFSLLVNWCMKVSLKRG